MNASKLSMPRRRVRGSAQVFGIGNRIAALHLLARDAERELVGKEIVGDPHLVAIRVGAEREQRRMLRLPAEPADAAVAGCDIDDDRGAPAHAVAIAIVRIVERQQRLVGNRFDEARRRTAGSARAAR